MYPFPSPLQTKYNENYFSNSHFIWKQCADNRMVEKIIELGESNPSSDALIGSGVVNKPTRNSILSWIYRDENSSEVFEFLIDKINSVNYYHYGMKLYGIEYLQYSRYPLGGHYRFHNDITVKKEDYMRKMSIVIGLNSEDSYEGGDFLLSPQGENPQSFRLDKGDLIAFPSYVPHKVTPVTSGSRITLVGWAVGPKFV